MCIWNTKKILNYESCSGVSDEKTDRSHAVEGFVFVDEIENNTQKKSFSHGFHERRREV